MLCVYLNYHDRPVVTLSNDMYNTQRHSRLVTHFSLQAICAGIKSMPKGVLFGVTPLMLSNQYKHPKMLRKGCFYVRRCLEKIGVVDSPGGGLGEGVNTMKLLMALGLGFKRGVSSGREDAKKGLEM